MIRLQQSQRLAEQGKFDEALAELDAIDGAGSDAETRALVSLRAARLLLWTAKHDEAIRRLDAPTREVFPGLASEIEGDALSAQGKRDEARAAYEAALTHLDAGSPYRAQVVLKLIEAGGQIPDETQTGT
jgi:predicted negative regulator of RcsB-dependent stress response